MAITANKHNIADMLLGVNMPICSTYVLIASMDVEPAKESLFNEVYDEHVEHLLRVPGVTSVVRMKGEPFSITIGGTTETRPAPNPIYTAIYEITDPSVLSSAAWNNAVEQGRWPLEVRPHTRNRTHFIYRKCR
jgi:hypothetical protein